MLQTALINSKNIETVKLRVCVVIAKKLRQITFKTKQSKMINKCIIQMTLHVMFEQFWRQRTSQIHVLTLCNV